MKEFKIPCNQYNAIHGKEILGFFSKPKSK
jgi:hypothetical protein